VLTITVTVYDVGKAWEGLPRTTIMIMMTPGRGEWCPTPNNNKEEEEGQMDAHSTDDDNDDAGKDKCAPPPMMM
jgi:hypothetical protein